MRMFFKLMSSSDRAVKSPCSQLAEARQMERLVVAARLAAGGARPGLEIHLPVLSIQLTGQEVELSSVAARLRGDDGIALQPPARRGRRLVERERLVRRAVAPDVDVQAAVGGLYRPGDVEVLARRRGP